MAIQKDLCAFCRDFVVVSIVESGGEDAFDPTQVLVGNNGVVRVEHNSAVLRQQSQFENVVNSLVEFVDLHRLCYASGRCITKKVIGVQRVHKVDCVALLTEGLVQVMDVHQLIHSLSLELILSVQP